MYNYKHEIDYPVIFLSMSIISSGILCAWRIESTAGYLLCTMGIWLLFEDIVAEKLHIYDGMLKEKEDIWVTAA